MEARNERWRYLSQYWSWMLLSLCISVMLKVSLYSLYRYYKSSLSLLRFRGGGLLSFGFLPRFVSGKNRSFCWIVVAWSVRAFVELGGGVADALVWRCDRWWWWCWCDWAGMMLSWIVCPTDSRIHSWFGSLYFVTITTWAPFTTLLLRDPSDLDDLQG